MTIVLTTNFDTLGDGKKGGISCTQYIRIFYSWLLPLTVTIYVIFDAWKSAQIAWLLIHGKCGKNELKHSYHKF